MTEELFTSYEYLDNPTDFEGRLVPGALVRTENTVINQKSEKVMTYSERRYTLAAVPPKIAAFSVSLKPRRAAIRLNAFHNVR